MRFLSVAATALTLAASGLASNILVNNYCDDASWLTITRGNQNTEGPTKLPASQAYTEVIPYGSVGNSLGVTKTDQYWSPQTPKLIFGYSSSTKDGRLYWSITSVDGNPFPNGTFRVTSTNNVCGNETTTTGPVYSCRDGAVTLTLDLCP